MVEVWHGRFWHINQEEALMDMRVGCGKLLRFEKEGSHTVYCFGSAPYRQPSSVITSINNDAPHPLHI